MLILNDLIAVALMEQAIRDGGGKIRGDEDYDIAPPRTQTTTEDRTMNTCHRIQKFFEGRYMDRNDPYDICANCGAPVKDHGTTCRLKREQFDQNECCIYCGAPGKEHERSFVSRDITKLRDAQKATDALPEGPGKAALIFAVQQWMHAAFIDHSPLTGKDLERAQEIAKRFQSTAAVTAVPLGGHTCHDDACDAKGNHGCHVDNCSHGT